MLAIGRSPPSITPCLAAETTSPHAIGTALPPRPLIVSEKTLACWTRIFLPLQVLRLDDRAFVGPEVAEAEVVEEQKLELVFLLEFLIEAVADLAVEHGVGLLVVLHQIGDEEHAHLGEYGCRRAGRTADGDVAGLDGVHDLQLLGDQCTAEELHVERTLASRIELLGHPFEFRRRRRRAAQECGQTPPFSASSVRKLAPGR